MGKALSSFKQKVDWMVGHQEVWACWPKALRTDDQIKDMMVEDGLISKNSNNYDIMDFGKLVAAAREVVRKKAKRCL